MNYVRQLLVTGLTGIALCIALPDAALAQNPHQAPPPRRGPQFRRPAPPPRRPYYHDYNGAYYQAPVYAPPPVVYAPAPSVGINLVIPFHF